MHMQPNTCTNEAFSSTYLQDLIPTLAGAVASMFYPAKVGVKSCRCAREYFIYACTYSVACACLS